MVDVGVFGALPSGPKRGSPAGSRPGSAAAPNTRVQLGSLTADEREQLDMIVALRTQDHAREDVRKRLTDQHFDGRVTVRAHLWLVDAALHTALHEHCLRTGDAETFRSAIDANRATVDVSIGQPPLGGDDWTVMDAPRPVRDAARSLFEQLRAALSRAVEDIADSGLIEAATGHPFPAATDGIPEFRLVAADEISRARVETFAAETERLARIADEVTLRLRFEALRCRHGSPRTWRERRAMRTREALASLDMMRAMQAAIIEVEAACAVTWSSHVIVDHTLLELNAPLPPADRSLREGS